jgi:hypothetical protein
MCDGRNGMIRSKKMLYDKSGAKFFFDHEHESTVYVRPVIKVFSVSCDDDYQEEGEEEADYIVTRKRDELFDAPPFEVVDTDIKAKQAELNQLKSEIQRIKRESDAAIRKSEFELNSARRQLKEWMAEHKVMMDIGKLIEGKTLYPLTIGESSYHCTFDVPRIPETENAGYLTLSGGDWESGKTWRCKRYSSDSYSSDFQFFDTEEERTAVISDAFASVCEAFRIQPNFSQEGGTYSTSLDFGTLQLWVKRYSYLTIPDDILAARKDDEAKKIAERKAKLSAELASIS